MNKIEAMKKCRETKMPVACEDGTVFSYTAAGVYEHEPDSGKRVLRRQKYINEMSLSNDVKKSDIGELMSMLQKEKEESEPEIVKPKPKKNIVQETYVESDPMLDIVDLLNPRFEKMNTKLNDISTFLAEKHKMKQTRKKKQVKVVHENDDDENVVEESIISRPKVRQPEMQVEQAEPIKNNLIDEIADLFSW